MKPFLLFSAILLFAGACSQPSGTESVIALPEESHIVALDHRAQKVSSPCLKKVI